MKKWKKNLTAAVIIIVSIFMIFFIRIKTTGAPTGTYVADRNMAAITILNGNEMRLNGPKEVSAALEGQYVREGNKLVLSLAEQEDSIFLIKNKSLVLESSAWLENWVGQGTVFYLSGK